MDNIGFLLIGISLGIQIASSSGWQRWIPTVLVFGIYFLFDYIVPTFAEQYAAYITGVVFLGLMLLVLISDRRKRQRI